MQLSKIGSKNTYHKCIKELHNAQYIYYHPGASRFSLVRISINRLDGEKEPTIRYRQLHLFESNECSVPNTVHASTNFDTGTVPKEVHSLKPNNSKQYSVSHPHNSNIKKEKEKQFSPGANINLQPPGIEEIEIFFTQHNYPISEAQKFYYYNHGKEWMLTNKLPITNWQAIAQKWMLNYKQEKIAPSPSAQQANSATDTMDNAIQAVYHLHLQGIRVSKMIHPQWADYLQLSITETIKAEAIQRRINQLSGSNERSLIQLWQAYMTEQWTSQLIIEDAPNLIALTKRLAVLKHFQKLKRREDSS